MTVTKLSDDEPVREPWRPYVLLGLALLAVGFAAWRPIPVGVWHDDGVYMLVGKALAEGHGFSYQGVVGAPPAVKFPPIYPLLVAGAWTVFRDIGPVTLALTLANLVFLAAAGALLARAFRIGAGLPRPVALLAGGLAIVSADVLRTSSAVLSEPLFLLLVAWSLTLWPRPLGEGAQNHDGSRGWLLLGGVLLLMVGTRAAGLPFVAGFALAAALSVGLRPAALLAAPAVVGWLAWTGWAAGRAREVPADMADLLGPYSGWLREQIMNDPASFLARFPAHAMGVAERVLILLLPRTESPWLWLAAFPLLVLLVAGWSEARRRLPPLAWCALGYAALLLLWPYLGRRLVVPLHVVLVGFIALGGYPFARRREPSAVASRVTPANRLRWLGAAAIVWAGFYSVVTTVRIADEWPTAGYVLRAQRLAGGVEAMTRTVPGDAVVGAPEFWAGLHLHGGWTVAPSVLFDPASTDLEAPSWGSPEAQERLWRSAGIEYLLLEQGGLLHGATLDRLEARCPGAIAVLARVPPMLVVRLPWATREGAATDGASDGASGACPPAA